MNKGQQQFDYQKTNSGSLKVIFENVDENQFRLRKDSLFQNPLSGPNNLKIEGEDLGHDLLGIKHEQTNHSANEMHQGFMSHYPPHMMDHSKMYNPNYSHQSLLQQSLGNPYDGRFYMQNEF